MDNREKTLALLIADKDEYVSGERLSCELGVSRTAVWKDICALRDEGFIIEARSRAGYLYISSPDILNATELKVRNPLWNFTVFDEIGSTNTAARNLADENAREKTIVLARSQTVGRGRFARHYESPRDKGIWMSVLLRPSCELQEATLFTVYAAVALNNVFERICGVRTGIKWINDMLLNGRKMVGILTEASSEGEMSTLRHIVIGIGINVGQTEDDFPPELRQTATSLYRETGVQFKRSDIISALCSEIDKIYRNGHVDGHKELIEAYRRDLCMLGSKISIFKTNGAEQSGLALDIDDSGALIVMLEDGTKTTLNSGEISIRNII